MNTITVVRAETSTAPHTCEAPRRAASRAGTPSSRSRKMFSSTTIAASTTIPTANARPAREMTLIDRPRAAIATNDPTMETGIASTTVSRRPSRAQEDEQHEGREDAADVDVLLDQIEGGIDVHGLVVDLPEGEPGLVDGARRELRGGGPQPVHGLDDVRADLPLDAHREGRGAEVADPGAGLLVREAHIRDVPDGEPRDPSRRRVPHRSKEHPAHVFDRLDRPLGADHVPALAFLDLARADRGVGRAQTGKDLAHRQAVLREPEGVDLGPKLAPAGAVDVRPAHPGDPLQPLLDHVLHELAERVDRPVVAGLGGGRRTTRSSCPRCPRSEASARRLPPGIPTPGPGGSRRAEAPCPCPW